MSITVDAPYAERCDLGEGPHWNASTARLTYVDIDAGTLHELDPGTGTVVATSVATAGQLRRPGRRRRRTGVRDRRRADVARRRRRAARDARRRARTSREPHERRQGRPGGAPVVRLDVAEPDDRCGGLLPARRRRAGHDRRFRDDLQRARLGPRAAAGCTTSTRRGSASTSSTSTSPAGRSRTAGRSPRSTPTTGCRTVSPWMPTAGSGSPCSAVAPCAATTPTASWSTRSPLPVTCPTCPAFGGADLSTLFVTTSRHRLSDAQRAEQPLAGALLVVDAGVRGRAGNPVDAAVAAAIGGPA